MKTKIIRHILTLSAISTGLAASLQVQAATAAYKHVAVPPEQMAQQKLPSAQSKGVFSHSTMLPITRAALAGKVPFEYKIDIDGEVDSPIVLLAPEASNIETKLYNPMGKLVYDESAAANAKPLSQVRVGPETFSGKEYRISKAMPGEWTVTLNYSNAAPKHMGKVAKSSDIVGYLLFKGDSSLQAVSYLDNNFTTLNSDINVVAYAVDALDSKGNRAKMVKQEPLPGSVDSAIALIKSPSGKQYRLRLNDEGINGDKVAGDGKYSAKVPTNEVGNYINQVQIKGHNSNGKPYSRTTTDVYPIATKSFEFADSIAQIKPKQGTTAILSVPVKQFDDSDSVFLSAEVWGTDTNGDAQSAAWVGGIVEPQMVNGKTVLNLQFDTRWLTRQNLHAPYSLKSLRLQTTSGNIPLAQRDFEKAASVAEFRPEMGQSLSQKITQDMLMGKAPASKSNSANSTAPTGGPALLLVHGYCSGHVWNESNFYNSAEFKDYKQNISHNTFAQRIRNFGNAYSSYGIVAHSQGGAAALELYSKFWSGLDSASGGRLIQSVGTPYQGTALAGNLAAIGEVFGAGCGTNTDLTYSGASNWLSTIPSWARSAVDYYTTSFTDNWWSYDYCHLATDMFLDDPEDGTTEKWAGQLSGATNKGHKTGWCHTSGMRDPAQTTDQSRNSYMSSHAAR